MTSDPSPPVARRTSIGHRILQGGWSTGLFVIGVLIDAMGLMNVPGLTTVDAGELTLKTAGAGFFLLVLAAWATVYWRRRAPLAPLLAGVALLLLGTSYVLFLIGVFEALLAWRSRSRRIVILAGMAIAFFAAREAFTSWGGSLVYFFASDPELGADHPLAKGLTAAVVAVLSGGAVCGAAVYARARGEADASRRRAEHEERRADALSVAVARQLERESVARDIHDTLASGLAVLSLQAGALEVTAAHAAPDELEGRARGLREQAHSALEDLRGLLGALRSSAAQGAASAAPALKSLGPLLRRQREQGVSIEPYVFIEDAERASHELEASVFRVVQESLTNAMKHASGAPVSVFVEVSAASGARIRVSNPLSDSGSAVPGAGQGTRGIRERAASLGGTAWIGAHEGSFLVDVTLPWRERE